MKAELLAPAGSYQTAVAAIEAGADAVYMGGMKFGARAYAENGDEDTIIKAIEYAHLHGKALYLTVNTLLKNKELEEELYTYLLPYYRAGLDAVIVQDPGVLLFVKRHFPDLPVHASTQMTITGKHGARLLEQMGCTRIVTARELSLEEISEIRKYTSVEIESFVHGALCYCYSGQCLMSSLLGGRSGNRGRCAQPCRLPYSVYEQNKQINSEHNQYALSPKDMCTIEILPQILEAGVYSLKIEGRMKKPEYTAGVVRIYRKYLDLYLKSPKAYKVDPDDLQELFDLYNRDGFHTGYYKDHNGPNMMAVKNLKATKGQKIRNEALFAQIRQQYIDEQKPIQIKGTLELHKGQNAKLMMENLVIEGAVVEPAMKQPLESERVRKQMLKTGNTPFAFSELQIRMDSDIFMPMQALNELRRTALEALEKSIVSAYYREVPEVSYMDEAICKTDKASLNSAFAKKRFSVSVDTKEQLKVALASAYVDRIYASISLFSKNCLEKEVYQFITEAKSFGKECYLALPHIVRHKKMDFLEEQLETFLQAGLSGYLVRSLEALSILFEKNLQSYAVLDANLYTYNSRAQKFYRSLGVMTDTVPYELNGKELRHRNNQSSEMVIYGYQPLMVSAQCIKKNFSKCSKQSEILAIRDRYNKKFQVKCFCDFCYNVIYNSVPLGLLKESKLVEGLQMQGLRLNFTMESPKEMLALLQEFYEVYFEEQASSKSSESFTKGHLKRGVE